MKIIIFLCRQSGQNLKTVTISGSKKGYVNVQVFHSITESLSSDGAWSFVLWLKLVRFTWQNVPIDCCKFESSLSQFKVGTWHPISIMASILNQSVSSSLATTVRDNLSMECPVPKRCVHPLQLAKLSKCYAPWAVMCNRNLLSNVQDIKLSQLRPQEMLLHKFVHG